MRRPRRLLLQIALLPLLWALATADTNLFTIVVALVAVIAWLLSGAVAAILGWLAHVAEAEAAMGGLAVPASLAEAADNALTMFLIATGIAVAAGLGAARVLGVLPPVGPILLAFLGWALVLVGVPAISWLGTLRRVWLPMLGRLRR